MSTETEDKVVPVDAKPGELLADTDKDLVGSSVMISYSRKGQTIEMEPSDEGARTAPCAGAVTQNGVLALAAIGVRCCFQTKRS
jgi:hypothetical protein